MSDEPHDILPLSTPGETAADIAAVALSIVPWLGGPHAEVLGGYSIGRKLSRIREVILETANAVKDIEDEVSHNYVSTDEFQELLERTLRQAANERNDEKRRIYSAFLAGDIASPELPYDEKIRILRTMEELQPDHIHILKAMLQKPAPVTGQIGSIAQTLSRRVHGISKSDMRDRVQDLTDMRLVPMGRINTMMTATGAEQLMNYITPYGRQVLSYIIHEPE